MTLSPNNWLCVSTLALSAALVPGFVATAQEAEDAPAEQILLTHDRYDPIYVLGDRVEDDPGAVSNLGGDVVADIAADHPAEVLNTLPGVNIQMNSGQEHLLAIRSPVLTGGAGQGSFLILENGVPTRSPAFGNVNILIEPHHEVASAIEVVRGPGSARYGSNAVHGIVNILLPDPAYTYESLARISYGSLGRYRGDLALSNANDLAINASIMHDNGWRDDTGIDQQKLSIVKTTMLGDWDASFWASGSNLEQETAGFIQGIDAYEDEDIAKSNPNPEAWRNAWSVRLGARLEGAMAGGLVTVTPYLHSQAMQFIQHFLPYNGIEKNRHTGGGFQLAYENRLSEGLTYLVGLDGDVASGSLSETQERATFGFNPARDQFPQGVHYDYTVDTTMLGLWGELNWELTEDMKIVAGLRGETHDYDYSTDASVGINGRFNVVADRSDSFDLITPKLGIIYTPHDTSYYANYARGERAPQASDLYRLQSQQVAGEIDTETLDSFEVGVRRVYGPHNLSFDLSAYWMEKDNFFFRDSDGLNVPNGKTEHKGVELQASWDASDTVTVSGNVAYGDHSYAFNRTADSIVDGNKVDTAPELLVDLRADWQATDALRLNASAEYIGEYFTNPGNTREYPGHTVLSLGAEYALDDGHAVKVQFRNVTDERYADRADFAFGNERYFPGEPANVTFSLTRKF